MSRILHVMSVSRGVDFIGNTVGLAKVSALCSRHSGAVNQVNGTLTQFCQAVWWLNSQAQSLSCWVEVSVQVPKKP